MNLFLIRLLQTGSMNTQDLKQWMVDPSRLNRENMLDLKSTLEAFPCFSIARVLYLKSLLNLNDVKLPAEMVRTAISIPDRRRLFFFMEGKKMPEYRIQPPSGLLETGSFSVIDRYLKSADPSPAESSVLAPEAQAVQPEAPKPAAQRKPMLESDAALMDYSRYLLNKPEAEQPVVPMEGQDLIDRFLEVNTMNEPVIKPRPVEVHLESDISRISQESVQSMLDDPDFHLPEDSFTETLARIYLKQKRYDRAVEIFRSLCLKYPEKSSYFADQIRFLEKLIANLKH